MMFDRYLNPADQNLRRVTKADKDFAKRLDFKDIKFSVRIRDIHKIKKKKSISISVFGYGIYVQTMYQNNVAKKKMLTYY